MGRNKKDGTMISCKINSQLLNDFDNICSLSGKNRTQALEEAMASYSDFYNSFINEQIKAYKLPQKQACVIDAVEDDLLKIRTVSGSYWECKNNVEIDAIEPLYDKELDTFRSEMSHELKHSGDLLFMDKVSQTGLVDLMLSSRHETEALYTVSLVDYLCRRNGIPLLKSYEHLRNVKLPEPVYPYSAVLRYRLNKDPLILIRLRSKAIKEFLDHNIIEGDIDNVC